MTENQQQNQHIRQAIMLDLSVFILDLLDTEKIKKKALAPNYILEVPSALALMIHDAKSGSPILFLFIHALLKRLKRDYIGKPIQDQRIINLIQTSDLQIRNNALTATKVFVESFAPLIHQQHITDNEIVGNESRIYFIKRYDTVDKFSYDEQQKLQQAYTSVLGLPINHLYDLYFVQLAHAQAVGRNQTANVRRKTISLGSGTFDVLSSWKKKKPLDEEQNASFIDTSRKVLGWFIQTFFKDNWQQIALDLSYDLPLAIIQNHPNSLHDGTIAITLITLTAGTILKNIPAIPNEILNEKEKKVLFFLIAFLIVVSCGIIYLLKSISSKQASPLPTPSIETRQITSIPVTATVEFTSTVTHTPLPTFTASPTLPPPPSATAIFNPNYCRYLTQPDDTAQSISSWFGISEEVYRSENNSDAGTERTAGQIVTINAPCCNAQYSSWHTYEVKQGDRLYNLANLSGISVNDLAYANHITNQEYIQTGQMLCIPPEYP